MTLLDTNTLLIAIALVYGVGGALVYAGRDQITSRGAEIYWLGGSLLTMLAMLCLTAPLNAGWLLPAVLLAGAKNELLGRGMARLTESARPWCFGPMASLMQVTLLLAAAATRDPHYLRMGFLFCNSWFLAGLAWLLLHKRRKRGPAARLIGGYCALVSIYLFCYILRLDNATTLLNDHITMLLGICSAVILPIGFIQVQRDLQYRQLSKLAALDPLTGIFNRRTFLDLALRQCALHVRHQRTLSLLMIDLDHFKRINDTYGHSRGDQALRAVADCLADEVRQGDIFARIGGEEFCLQLPDTDLDGARQVANKLCQAIQGILLNPADPDTRLTASIGVATLPPGSTMQWNQLFETADRRLYLAKTSGRNRAVWSDNK